jgi:hypothetical protein
MTILREFGEKHTRQVSAYGTWSWVGFPGPLLLPTLIDDSLVRVSTYSPSTTVMFHSEKRTPEGETYLIVAVPADIAHANPVWLTYMT